MTIKLPLSCSCGQVKGTLEPKGIHVVCFCKDCQAFAHFLGTEEMTLCQNGGTEIYQVHPCQLKIEKGQENLSSMKLGPRGALRWYTSCCKTPVANTMNAQIAFNGIIHSFMDFKNFSIDKETVLGKIDAYVQGQYGKGELPKGTHPKFPKWITFKVLKLIFWGKILKRNKPNVFFKEDGKPIKEPLILSKEQRAQFTV